VCGKTPVGEIGFDLDFSSQSGLHHVRRQRRNGAERLPTRCPRPMMPTALNCQRCHAREHAPRERRLRKLPFRRYGTLDHAKLWISAFAGSTLGDRSLAVLGAADERRGR
jgi:hypothetical protein